MPDPAHPAHQRVLEAAAKRGVVIEIVTFDESTHTAQEAADAIGVELGQIVKSLVFMAPTDPAAGEDAGTDALVALLRGTDRVDVARLAAASGRPRLRRATAKEATSATGFVIGGIPPFGHRERLSVIMDPGLDGYEEVWAAAGTPNGVFPIAPATLAMICDAQVLPFAADPEPEATSA